MAIQFEKKVILGSVTSFIIAAIGVVAVFFPDLFNLQKKGIKEFNYEISDIKTAENFSKEMEKIVGGLNTKEDKSLYHYNIKICAGAGYRLENDGYQTAENKKDNTITYLQVNHENGSLGFMSYTADEDRLNAGGEVYNFNIPVSWDKNSNCGGVEADGASIIEGYAYYAGSGFGQGIAEYMFTTINEKDIKLKDY